MSGHIFDGMIWGARKVSDGWVDVQPFCGSAGDLVAVFGNFQDAELFRRFKFLDESLRAMDEILSGGFPVGKEAQEKLWFDLQCLAVSGLSFVS